MHSVLADTGLFLSVEGNLKKENGGLKSQNSGNELECVSDCSKINFYLL